MTTFSLSPRYLNPCTKLLTNTCINFNLRPGLGINSLKKIQGELKCSKSSTERILSGLCIVKQSQNITAVWQILMLQPVVLFKFYKVRYFWFSDELGESAYCCKLCLSFSHILTYDCIKAHVQLRVLPFLLTVVS